MDIKSLYKKFLQQKSISVPKNKIKSKQAIPVSKLGLWDKNKNKVIVPSNRITMKGPKGEQDFFKKPVLATGLQSGKKVMMQPGREYYFPEDEAVFETKMQDGGKIDLTNDIAALNPNNKKSSNFQALELALAPVTFLPPPTGTIAGLASAGINLAQGDLPGLGLDVAGVASGGVSKVFKAAMQEAKLAGAGRVAKNMGDKAKFFNAASNPNIYKSMGFARDYYSNEQDNSNARTNYKDNTRVASPIKPVKSKMQYGGLFPVGPYDEMIAPKQGNYLLPDINRPYYIDDEGGRRSEYRTGINIDGKETLLPTVVGGRQLTDEQAEDQYMRTGLNMGKFNNVEDADYASRLRTARYNMFEDPVRFSADQFQGGGTVKTSMIEEPKKDSLPILLDSLLSQYQKTKAEFDVDSDNPKMQFGAISYNLDEPEPIRPPDQKPLKEGAGKLNTWLYNQAVADRKKQQSLFDAEQATDKELAYTKRANYMDLLTNEFYGTDRPFDDLTEEEQNNLLDIVQNRKSNLNNLSLKAADLTKKGIKAGYDPNRNIMVVPKVPVKRGVHSHELSHVGDQGPFATRENPGVGPYFTEQINQSMYGKDSSDFLNQPSTLKKDKTVGQNIETGFNEAEYLRDPSEVKARLKALRDASVEQGYQLLKPDYDINNYKSGFTEDETNQYNQLKSSGLSDEKINELMYLFAKQNTPQPVIAQSGAELSTEQNPVRMNPIDIAAKRRNPNYRTYLDNVRVVTPFTGVDDATRLRLDEQKAEEARRKRSGVISQGTPETSYKKAKRKSSFVEQERDRTGSAGPLSYVLDVVNPAMYGFSAIDLVDNTGSAVQNVAQGNFQGAGSDIVQAAVNALTLLPVAKGFKGAVKPLAKYVGATPAQYRAAQQFANNPYTETLKYLNSPSKSARKQNKIETLQTPLRGVRQEVKAQEAESLDNLLRELRQSNFDFNELRFPPSENRLSDRFSQNLAVNHFDLNLVREPRNISGLTKEETLLRAAAKEKELLSKMSNQEFRKTVLKPTGEITPTDEGSIYDYFKDNNAIASLSPEEYTDLFNSRLDLLDEIIAERNKSGVEYGVKGLDKSGRLTFYTPQQTLANATKPVPQHYLDALDKIDEPGFLYKGYNDQYFFSNMTGSPGFNSQKEAKNWITNRIEESQGKKIPAGESTWAVNVNPGQWRGEVQDIANKEYFQNIPGLEISNSTEGVFADRIPRTGSGAYESINEYLKKLDLGRVKSGFNSQTEFSRGAWENFIKSGRAVGYYGKPTTVYGTMKSFAPIGAGIGLGASQLQTNQTQPQMQMGGMSIPRVNGTVVASSPSLYSKAKKRKK